MQFFTPENLLLLTLLPVLIAIILRADRVKINRIRAINAELSVRTTGKKRAVITTLFLACIIFAMARPYSGFTEIKRGNYGVDNLVIFDISDSMLADDVKPSRLEIGKRKILDLASLLREKNIGERIGVILFAGQAYLYCPPTVDFGALKQFVSHISAELISSQGSGINMALDTASEIIKRLNMKSPRLFIFTDGEDIGFSEERAATTLKNLNIKPLILGIGTETGAPIDIPGEGFVRNSEGNLVITKLNQQNLQGLSNSTDGRYVSSEVSLSDLRYLLENSVDLNNNRENETSTIRVYNEYGHIFIWGALSLLLLSTLFHKSIPIVILLLAGLIPSKASATPNVYEAWKLYEEGEYQKAKPGFETALKESPDSPELLQALGSIEFKLGNFKEAAETFSQLKSNAGNKTELFAGQYNLGNTLLQSKQYDQAIKEYEEALKIKPSDEAAKFNLELAKKLKEEPPQNQEQNNDKKENEENKENQDKKDDQQSSGQNEDKKNPKDKQESSPRDNSDDTSQESSPNESKNKEENQKQPAESMTEKPEAKTEQELAKEEADKWLNSLPTAPVQIRRNQQRSRVQNGQTW
jgi:Ca-activated chloride channel family protein